LQNFAGNDDAVLYECLLYIKFGAGERRGRHTTAIKTKSTPYITLTFFSGLIARLLSISEQLSPTQLLFLSSLAARPDDCGTSPSSAPTRTTQCRILS
jgi:hypothetical protein